MHFTRKRNPGTKNPLKIKNIPITEVESHTTLQTFRIKFARKLPVEHAYWLHYYKGVSNDKLSSKI
jgi:hypothetical protein